MASFDTLKGFDDAQLFELQPGLSLPPDPCRIDEHVTLAAKLEGGIHRVPGRPRNGAHQHPRRTEDMVHQCGFPDVGTSDHGDTYLRRVFGFYGFLGLCGDAFGQAVQQGVDAVAVGGADGVKLLDPEFVELGRVTPLFGPVDLVDHKEHGFRRAAEQVRQF